MQRGRRRSVSTRVGSSRRLVAVEPQGYQPIDIVPSGCVVITSTSFS